MATIRPTTVAELSDAIADATASSRRLEIRGGGSKADIGTPDRDADLIDMTGFTGVVDYDPAELVLTVRAGTPLAEVEALVEREGQMLAFEPFDHGPIFGRPAGAATIGGVVAAGVAGSRRLAMGGPRDHLLGFEAVSGRGERFVAGGKVVKNVTGYDLPKLMAGSWGRLAVMAELTLKVLPRGRVWATVALSGLDPATAHAAMARALRAPAEVSAAAHLPANGNNAPLTALRIEGFGPSVEARCGLLSQVLAPFGTVDRLSEHESDRFWNALRTLETLPGDHPLWRVNVPPSGGCAVVNTLEPLGACWLFDWAGGLIWLTFEGDPAAVRAAAAKAGGHAMLVRGPAELRARIPALHPEAPGITALSARVRRAFDPAGIFETGRFLDHPDAH